MAEVLEVSITVKNRNVSIGPRKIRQVVSLIRKKKASDAIRILRFCDKKEIAIMLTKLINSGLDIAANSEKYDLDNLVLGRLTVDGARPLKRIQPRAQGRAFRIYKRTSHVTIELKEA